MLCNATLRRSTPNRDCLAGLQYDWRFRLVGEKLVNGLAGARTGRKAIVIEDHHTTGLETRIDEFAAIPYGSIDVHVHVGQGDLRV